MEANLKFINVALPEYKDIITSKKDDFTKEDIMKFVDTFKTNNLVRLNKLKSYYSMYSMLDVKPNEDEHIPNHKVKAAGAKLITNMASSYFMGIPVSWETDDEELGEIISAIVKSNVDGNFRYRLAKDCSKYGVGYSLLWRDEDAHFRYNVVDPTECFIVHDDTVERNAVLGIRIVTINDEEEKIEVYDATKKWSYTNKKVDGENTTNESDEEQHFMSDVPIIEYANNIDKTSDFEPVLSLMEAYNISISSTANDIEAFADAYLALVGYTGTNREDFERLKKNRVLLLDADGNAFFITKQVNDAMQVNYRQQLINDIHKYSQVPNLSDEEFAGNLSGVAIRFKLIGLDALAGEKEQMMREGMRKELEAIAHHIKQRNLLANTDIKLNSDDYVKITFHRNLPQNVVEIAQTVNIVGDLVSERTRIAQLPFVENVQDELDRKKEEYQEEITPSGPISNNQNKVGEDNGEETEE